jgi:hypothetical protein
MQDVERSHYFLEGLSQFVGAEVNSVEISIDLKLASDVSDDVIELPMHEFVGAFELGDRVDLETCVFKDGAIRLLVSGLILSFHSL